MLQWLKKIVPDPRFPEMGGSSPWWTETAATLATAPALQNPFSPESRSAPHSRGHNRQEASGDTSRPAAARMADDPAGST